jgi:hypothetical protein
MRSADAAWLLAVAALLAPWAAVGQTLRWSDEFLPSDASGYINGGIDISLWSFHLGDGSDFGIPGGSRRIAASRPQPAALNGGEHRGRRKDTL